MDKFLSSSYFFNLSASTPKKWTKHYFVSISILAFYYLLNGYHYGTVNNSS